ncbi:hypothetical protein DOY81_012524, partial [Sarcophaga bullata]
KTEIKMDLHDQDHHYLKLKNKGKAKTYLPKLEYLELKPRTRRQGKCVGAALEFFHSSDNNSLLDTLKEPPAYNYISNDIWFQLANYIAPEDVQRYALICRQSANSINSCRFWLQLYRQYCKKSHKKEWVLQLPANLQYD